MSNVSARQTLGSPGWKGGKAEGKDLLEYRALVDHPDGVLQSRVRLDRFVEPDKVASLAKAAAPLKDCLAADCLNGRGEGKTKER